MTVWNNIKNVGVNGDSPQSDYTNCKIGQTAVCPYRRYLNYKNMINYSTHVKGG
jgi:hypothetical protein